MRKKYVHPSQFCTAISTADGQVAAQLQKHGVSLDVVIANAAINTPESFANFEDVDPELVDLHLQVNVSQCGDRTCRIV